MQVRRRRADRRIAAVVRSFSERRASLGGTIVTAPLPARPDQFIEFYLGDRYRVSHDGADPSCAPEMVVVGPQSYRCTRLFMFGTIHVFTIGFQPGGFHALFGTAMSSLVNEGALASDVIGPAAGDLRDAIMRAAGFDARVAAAERWIGDRAACAQPIDAVARAAALLHRSGGRLRIDRLASEAELGTRQFTRRFEHQVGLTPKLFARTVRFNAALEAKARSPLLPWTTIVHAAGYADQAHFIRDCHAMAGEAPRDFVPQWLEGR